MLMIIFLMTSWANPAALNLADITKAIKAGDAQTLSQYFDQSVEIAVLEEEDVYDKVEAMAVVKKFFQDHQPQDFSEVHRGKSKGNDSQYCIGNLKTANSTYRVFIHMKIEAGKFLIQELRFDKETIK